ncbi:hypothetical protein DPMN_146447 [Dreissena polymorpha]|uniref:Uncharacterized protein n=1 Tax=Dreissena polymorpha TaxID=45954 RepID=A0A9D4FAB9_DREPO|nr:hypothetical protein DPMN_146447 [Dreissena polymorpha]
MHSDVTGHIMTGTFTGHLPARSPVRSFYDRSGHRTAFDRSGQLMTGPVTGQSITGPVTRQLMNGAVTDHSGLPDHITGHATPALRREALHGCHALFHRITLHSLYKGGDVSAASISRWVASTKNGLFFYLI